MLQNGEAEKCEGKRRRPPKKEEKVGEIVDSHEIASDATDELHVALHDGDSLRMQGAQVRVLEQVDEVAVRRSLRSGYCTRPSRG